MGGSLSPKFFLIPKITITPYTPPYPYRVERSHALTPRLSSHRPSTAPCTARTPPLFHSRAFLCCDFSCFPLAFREPRTTRTYFSIFQRVFWVFFRLLFPKLRCPRRRFPNEIRLPKFLKRQNCLVLIPKKGPIYPTYVILLIIPSKVWRGRGPP